MNMQTTHGLKLKACLNDLSARHQYEQAMLLDVLDTIVQDIHALNRSYTMAVKNNQLRLYVEEVRQVHQKWITLLQDLVNAHVTADTIDPLIEKMQRYAEQLIKIPEAKIEPLTNEAQDTEMPAETVESVVSAPSDAHPVAAEKAPQATAEYHFPAAEKSATQAPLPYAPDAGKLPHAS